MTIGFKPKTALFLEFSPNSNTIFSTVSRSLTELFCNGRIN